MTNEQRPQTGTDPEEGFRWRSPRWREPDGGGDAQPAKQRRFRDRAAPKQRGAIDAGDSVPRGDDKPDAMPGG